MFRRNILTAFYSISRKKTIGVISTKGWTFSTKIETNGTSNEIVNFSFVNKNGESVQVKAKEGQNLLEIAHANEIDLEGACDMSLACSTCHVILNDEIFSGIDPPSMEEEDLLDLAYGLTDTSRLGC